MEAAGFKGMRAGTGNTDSISHSLSTNTCITHVLKLIVISLLTDIIAIVFIVGELLFGIKSHIVLKTVQT